MNRPKYRINDIKSKTSFNNYVSLIVTLKFITYNKLHYAKKGHFYGALFPNLFVIEEGYTTFKI